MDTNDYKVDWFLLADEWKGDKSYFGIAHVIRSGGSKEYHLSEVEKIRRKLLSDSDDDYTSWILVDHIYKNISNIQPHVSVLHFRIKDIY